MPMLPSWLLEDIGQVSTPSLRPGQVEFLLLPTRAIFQPTLVEGEGPLFLFWVLPWVALPLTLAQSATGPFGPDHHSLKTRWYFRDSHFWQHIEMACDSPSPFLKGRSLHSARSLDENVSCTRHSTSHQQSRRVLKLSLLPAFGFRAVARWAPARPFARTASTSSQSSSCRPRWRCIMIKPMWRSTPGFVGAVRLTLDSSSLPRPSSLLLDSTVCPLEDDLPLFLFSRPHSPWFLFLVSCGVPLLHFLRRLARSAVTKVSAVDSSTLSANT